MLQVNGRGDMKDTIVVGAGKRVPVGSEVVEDAESRRAGGVGLG